MSDLKMEAAKAALKLIKPGMTVGLGAGTTMAHMVRLMKDGGMTDMVKLVTSSFSTRRLLLSEGFVVLEAGWLSQVDVYFDGCDQFDWRLTALKSGGGVFVSEK